MQMTNSMRIQKINKAKHQKNYNDDDANSFNF
jgi:hypothetical protein